MPLAIFDLDNTLINGDSDFLWGEFLVELGVVNAKTYNKKNKYFYNKYARGELDIAEFLTFSLKPLSKFSITKLNYWHTQFMAQKIMPILSQNAQNTVNSHKKNGDTVLVITATNEFVAKPIINHYGIANFLATEIEKTTYGYTGNFTGIPCFKDGKVARLKQWLAKNPISLVDSCFYSDSHNDIALLKFVDNPIAVNPDAKLKKYAKLNSWLIEDWF